MFRMIAISKMIGEIFKSKFQIETEANAHHPDWSRIEILLHLQLGSVVLGAELIFVRAFRDRLGGCTRNTVFANESKS